MNSKSYVESVKYKNRQMATSSKHQEARSEQRSHDGDQHYLPGKSLCLTSLPKTVPPEDLVNFFRQFGAIKKQHFGRNCFWIEYYDR